MVSSTFIISTYTFEDILFAGFSKDSRAKADPLWWVWSWEVFVVQEIHERHLHHGHGPQVHPGVGPLQQDLHRGGEGDEAPVVGHWGHGEGRQYHLELLQTLRGCHSCLCPRQSWYLPYSFTTSSRYCHLCRECKNISVSDSQNSSVKLWKIDEIMFRCGNKFDQKNKIQISDSDMEAFCEQCHNLVSGKIFFILMKFKPDPYFQAFIRLHVRQGKGWRRCSRTLPSSWPTPTGPGWSYRQ